VRNAAINLLTRASSSVQELTEDVFDNGVGPGELAARGEFRRRVAKALAFISKNEREAIMQHLYAGLTFREISELHDVPLSTVTSWYRRGLEKLRGSLKEE
jgi:RNA polymerase sigma-70 factor (ECF subfamily)